MKILIPSIFLNLKNLNLPFYKFGNQTVCRLYTEQSNEINNADCGCCGFNLALGLDIAALASVFIQSLSLSVSMAVLLILPSCLVLMDFPWFSKIYLMCSHPDIPFEFLISFLCMLSRMWKISDFSAQGQSTLRSPYLIHKIPKIFLNIMLFYFDYLPLNFQKFDSFFFKLKTIFFNNFTNYFSMLNFSGCGQQILQIN